MTAYLQAGDRIHLEIPLVVNEAQTMAVFRALEQDYERQGIRIFLVTIGEAHSPMRIVCVIAARHPVSPQLGLHHPG
jgi:hypothetical protein